MAMWLYQMDQRQWPPNSYRLDIWEHQRWSWPIGIRDVDERITDQCKGSAIFSPPKLLKSWRMQKVSLTERTVQGLLKLSGQWKSDAPGSEWFVTTLAEIERVVGIVQRETH